MKCRKPFGNYGCGQCIPCRVNRRRLWTGRILLEAQGHPYSSFVTLTYRQEECPLELEPAELCKFWKRLRKLVPFSIRYFAVGEYGSKTFRPHYHAIVFGLPFTSHSIVDKAWGKGHVQVGELTPQGAAYVTGYVSKKMTGWDDVRLEGRRPEFARMSLRPGLGKLQAVRFGEQLMTDGPSRALCDLRDVPSEIRVNQKKYPLGRYLRCVIRDSVGWEPGAPMEIRRQLAFEKSLETMEVMRQQEKLRERSEAVAIARLKISDSRRKLT